MILILYHEKQGGNSITHYLKIYIGKK